MPIYEGSTKIGTLAKGGTQMRVVYKGSQRVYYKYRSFSRIYTTSSSITIPSTAVNIQVWCVGDGGSGGGSSYTNDSLCSSVTHTQGFQSGNGYITLSILDGDPGYIVQETAYLAYADS